MLILLVKDSMCNLDSSAVKVLRVKGYPAGLTTDDKELAASDRPNSEGVVIRRVMGPRVAVSSPRTEWTALAIARPKKAIKYKMLLFSTKQI